MRTDKNEILLEAGTARTTYPPKRLEKRLPFSSIPGEKVFNKLVAEVPAAERGNTNAMNKQRMIQGETDQKSCTMQGRNSYGREKRNQIQFIYGGETIGRPVVEKKDW